ncbi:periplasmic binding protein [Rhodopirellula sallentina SM41]|uniref:Periplasmic binding protein n=1 Tax=Rhodopirellula sallentina SM41 TaxID=1263870 RepID=M5U4Y4_9BACT|nr:periplasmic binding protein [Rhodopirellula sallentina SM41]
MGLRDQLVGVTHECDYPADVVELPKVTKTLIPVDATSREIDGLVRERMKTKAALYSLDMDVLTRLNPDLIVTQALCDVCAVAEDEVRDAACSLPHSPRVINLEPSCLDDVMDCIMRVGDAADARQTAVDYVGQLKERVRRVADRSMGITDRPSVMMLEWIDPPFSAGHWSPELVEIAGGREAIGQAGERSVTTPWQQVVDADPDVVVIACCGYDVERTLQDVPILRDYPGWDSLSCVRSDRVSIVDGSAYFSRPGPRLIDSLEILAHALHPEFHPLPDGLPAAVRVACR